MYSFKGYFWNKNLNLAAIFIGREQLTDFSFDMNKILEPLSSYSSFYQKNWECCLIKNFFFYFKTNWMTNSTLVLNHHLNEEVIQCAKSRPMQNLSL